MTFARLSLAVFPAVVGVTACNRNATRDECAEMIDHYLDLTMAEDPDVAKLAPKEIALVREVKSELKLGEKSYKRVHDRCTEEITRGAYRCAVGAATSSEWESCIH